jgi:hypothetical protein
LMVEGKLIPENFNLTSINIIFDWHFWAGESWTCDGVAQILPKTKWLKIDPSDYEKMIHM